MVSVCIATYNGEKYILQQIKSILRQLNVEDEIIVSDDESTDNTIVLIESLKDNRIKISKNNNFKSPIYNFENALKHAVGDYIFLSDQDDVWLENKIDLMVAQMKLGYDVVVSDCEIVDENLKTVHPSYFAFNKSGPGLLKNVLKNSYMGCCMGFSKRLLEESIPFPSNLPMHDSYIGLIGELNFKVKFIYKPLMLHRSHSSNSSFTSKGKSNFSFTEKISFRLHLILNFSKKIKW
jgi:glycosyltransferase involved in cell wall biosynthesis